MADLTGFNANHYEDDAPDSYAPIKPGLYAAVITETEMRETQAGTGRYLMLTLQIIDGEFKNRRLWDRLNLVNPNETAVEIAKRNLASICRAVGVLTPRDSSELHDKPLQIRVTQRKRQDNGEIANDVKAYTAMPTTAKRIESKADHLAGVEAALTGRKPKSAPKPTTTNDDEIPF